MCQGFVFSEACACSEMDQNGSWMCPDPTLSRFPDSCTWFFLWPLFPHVSVITWVVVASRCSAGQASPCCEVSCRDPLCLGWAAGGEAAMLWQHSLLCLRCSQMSSWCCVLQSSFKHTGALNGMVEPGWSSGVQRDPPARWRCCRWGLCHPLPSCASELQISSCFVEGRR